MSLIQKNLYGVQTTGLASSSAFLNDPGGRRLALYSYMQAHAQRNIDDPILSLVRRPLVRGPWHSQHETSVITAVVMLIFEASKQLAFPHISLWQSHTETIVFASLFAFLASTAWQQRRGMLAIDVSAAIAITTAVVMFLFEVAKQALYPGITTWRSHLVTVVFATSLALAGEYFARHTHRALIDRVMELTRCIRVQITELDRHESALRESQERFAKAFQAGPDCLVISEVETGRILEINDRFEEITGFSTQEIIGSTASGLGLFHDPGLSNQLLEEFRSHERIRDFEYQLRRKSGEVATMVVSAVPIEIAGKRCAFSVHRDITYQKMAEEELRASEEKFAKAFDATPDSVVIIEAATQKIIDVNQGFEKVTGYSRREALGHTTEELRLWIDPLDRDRLRRKMQQHGQVREMEHRIRRKSGEIAIVAGSGVIIEFGGKKCFLTVNRDITAQKAAEEATRKAETKYRELVENASDIIFTVDLHVHESPRSGNRRRQCPETRGYQPSATRGSRAC